MAGQRSEFGYFPRPLDITVGPVSIATLAGLPETVADIEKGMAQKSAEFRAAGAQVYHKA